MPDGCLGRSIAPRGSSRSNCQVKAILHGVTAKKKFTNRGGLFAQRCAKSAQGLPIADPFEVEDDHCVAGADEELAVVLDLDKGDALFAQPVLLLSGKELGLRFGKVGDEPVQPWFEMSAGFDCFDELPFFDVGAFLPCILCCFHLQRCSCTSFLDKKRM